MRTNILNAVPVTETGNCHFETDVFESNSGLFQIVQCFNDIAQADSQGNHACTIRFED